MSLRRPASRFLAPDDQRALVTRRDEGVMREAILRDPAVVRATVEFLREGVGG